MSFLKSLLSSLIFGSASFVAMWHLGSSRADQDLQSGVPWLFWSILLVGFVWATRRFRIPCTRATETLRKAAQGLERQARKKRGDAGTDPSSEPDDPFRCPGAFVKDRRFSFSILWTRFTNAWRGRTGHPGSTEQPAGTASSGDFFTTESILGKRWDTIPDALPGVFTAVGLLGTFVGIAIGLSDIPQGDSRSAEDLGRAIDTLIGGMSTAFSTSIVGISASIWWIFEFRGARRKLESSLSHFVRKTDRLFPVEQPHETLMRIATANAKAARGLGALDGFTSLREDVASVKGGIQTLGQDMASALEPLIEKHIKEPIQNLNVDLGQRQTEALGQMVTEFRDTLVSHVGEELHRFGEALKSARAHQSSTVGELEAFFALLEEVSNTQLKVLDRGASVAATFERGLSAMTKSQEAVERAGSAARQIMEEAEALVGESRQQMAAQKEAAKALLESWDAERDTLSDLKKHFLALTSELGDKIREFRGLAAEKIAEVFHSFDSEMGKVTEHLGGTLAELRETTEEFPGVAIRLVDATSSLEEVSKAQHESLTQGFERFKKVNAQIAERLDLGREELMRANEQLPALVQEISQGIGGFVNSIQGVGAGFEEAAGTTVKAAAEASGLLSQNVTELRNTNKQFPEFAHRMGESSDRFAESVRQAESSVSDLAKRAEEADRRSVQGIEQLSTAAATVATDIKSVKSVVGPMETTIAAVRQSLETLDRTMSELPQKLSDHLQRQQAVGNAPPIRVGGVSQQGAGDRGRARPRGDTEVPTPIVPREALGTRGHGEPAGAGEQRETLRFPDGRESAPRHTDGDPRRGQTGGEFASRRVDDGASPTGADGPDRDQSRTRKPSRGWRRIRSFLGGRK